MSFNILAFHLQNFSTVTVKSSYFEFFKASSILKLFISEVQNFSIVEAFHFSIKSLFILKSLFL